MNENKKDNRPFCFCLGQQVDCIPGVVLDCNNKRTEKCPLEGKETVEKNKKSKTDEVNQNGQKSKKEKKEKDNRAFCFCVGAQVDCIPGVVLDCNNKRTKKCPLEAEKEKAGKNDENKADEANQGNQKNQAEKKNQKDRKNKTSQANQGSKKDKAGKDNRAFCFCVGAQVDCIPGVVLDCNNKRTKKCPLEAEKEKAEKNDGNKADEANQGNQKSQPEKKNQKGRKNKTNQASKKEKSGKDNRAFCFCVGELVDCIPGVVLDCNNKRTKKCPLLEDEAERKTKEFEQAVRELKARSHKEEEHKQEEVPEKEFCFCVGELVDCPPATVQDCNLKRTTTCKLREA